MARAVAGARTLGPGARYRPPAWGEAAARGGVVAGMACSGRQSVAGAAHVELFAYEHVVIVPAGIGVVQPLRHRSGRIVAARCDYPLRTLDPTGLVLLGDRSHGYRLRQLFELWGQRLDRTRMAGFRAPRGERVRVYVDGKAWRGDPRGVPLSPRAEIVVEVGGYVPPHASYSFPSLSWVGV